MTSTLTHGSHHVLLPYFEISQVSDCKTSITLRLFSNKLCAGRCQLAPSSTLTLTLTLTTIEFKWFKWFKEFKSLMKRLHVAKIVISIIPTKKKGDYFNSTRKIVLFYANIKLQCLLGNLIMIKEIMTSVFKQR